MTSVFAVSDVHGHLDALLRALHDAGLVTGDGQWAGADARLWFLGDYLDRGPDGVGVIDLVRRLVAESDGAVGAVLGNHEVLAVGKQMFDATPIVVPGTDEPRSFARSWGLNEGRETDQERLTDDHVAWLRTLRFAAHDGTDLLVHSDTLAYLDWGATTEELNAAGRERLASDDIDVWWQTWRGMTTRSAFLDDDGPAAARTLLDHLGGERIVHGHSIIAETLDCAYADVTEPWSYADGLALAIDGGLHDGGPCLVARLS